MWDQHRNDLSTQKLAFPYEIQKKNGCKSPGDSDVFLGLPC